MNLSVQHLHIKTSTTSMNMHISFSHQYQYQPLAHTQLRKYHHYLKPKHTQPDPHNVHPLPPLILATRQQRFARLGTPGQAWPGTARHECGCQNHTILRMQWPVPAPRRMPLEGHSPGRLLARSHSGLLLPRPRLFQACGSIASRLYRCQEGGRRDGRSARGSCPPKWIDESVEEGL